MRFYVHTRQVTPEESGSITQSMEMWNREPEDAEILFEDENIVVFSDHSYDDWNGRLGFVAQSKDTKIVEDTTVPVIEFSLHYTGQGFAWGRWNEFYLVGIPEHHYNGTVEKNLRKEWGGFDHPFLQGAKGSISYGMPMVPYTV